MAESLTTRVSTALDTLASMTAAHSDVAALVDSVTTAAATVQQDDDEQTQPGKSSVRFNPCRMLVLHFTFA